MLHPCGPLSIVFEHFQNSFDLECGPLSIVFEHFQNSFDLEDLTNGVFKLFRVCSYVMVRNIFKSITRMLRAT